MIRIAGTQSQISYLIANEIVIIIVTHLIWLLWVFNLSVRHAAMFHLDQPSSEDNEDIVTLSLSLHLTLKTQHRHTQASSRVRLLRSWMEDIGIVSYRQRGISSWRMTGSSSLSHPPSCLFCPCFLISSSLSSFKMMAVCSSCANQRNRIETEE